MKGCMGCLCILVFSAAFVATATYLWRVNNPAEAAAHDAQVAREAAQRAEERKDPNAGRELPVCWGMQKAVEARLKAPATADFPSCGWTAASHVKYDGGGHYSFSSWVDAQNGFGANIRTYYDGEATSNAAANDFQITRLTIHD